MLSDYVILKYLKYNGLFCNESFEYLLELSHL